MYHIKIIKDLIQLAHNYGNSNFGDKYIHPLEKENSSIIFNKLEFSFHLHSWNKIEKNIKYKERVKKIHPNTQTKVPVIYEMQSSNSSDALAMNIFCYPDFIKWKGIKTLFEVESFESIEFGFNPKIQKIVEGVITTDATEVDVFINGNIICECKLTETDFTSKEKKSVECYGSFSKVFQVDKLIQNDKSYANYQLIRNILATEQIQGRFILICDMRRPDLAKSFYQTIRCIKDEFIELRTNCEIIYWQDIANYSGKELKEFLNQKYGI